MSKELKLGEGVRVYNEYDEAIGDIYREDVPGLGERYVPYGLYNTYKTERLSPKDTLADAELAIKEWQES